MSRDPILSGRLNLFSLQASCIRVEKVFSLHVEGATRGYGGQHLRLTCEVLLNTGRPLKVAFRSYVAAVTSTVHVPLIPMWLRVQRSDRPAIRRRKGWLATHTSDPFEIVGSIEHAPVHLPGVTLQAVVPPAIAVERRQATTILIIIFFRFELMLV